MNVNTAIYETTGGEPVRYTEYARGGPNAEHKGLTATFTITEIDALVATHYRDKTPFGDLLAAAIAAKNAT